MTDGVGRSASGVTRLTDRIAQADRLAELYVAEGHGLRRALYTDQPVPYSHDPALQARFLLGLRDGREILMVHGEGRTA